MHGMVLSGRGGLEAVGECVGIDAEEGGEGFEEPCPVCGVLAEGAPGEVRVGSAGPAALPVPLVEGGRLAVLVVGAGAQELGRVTDVHTVAGDVFEAGHLSATHAIQAVVSSVRSLEERVSSLVGVAQTPPSSSSMRVQARPASSRTTVLGGLGGRRSTCGPARRWWR